MYGKYLVSDDFKAIQDDYVSKLDRMNKANAKFFAAGSAPSSGSSTKTEAPKSEAPKTEAPVAVPTISGKEDPNYKSLKKGKQFIFQGKTYTKTED